MTYHQILAESIIKECEYGYISYGNLHENDNRRIELIKKALEDVYIPAEPQIRIDEVETNGMKIRIESFECPKCRKTLICKNYINGKYNNENGLRSAKCCHCFKPINWEGVPKDA